MGIIEDWKLTGDDFSTALVKAFEAYLSFILTSTLQCRKIFFEVVGDASEVLAFDPFEQLDTWFTQSFIKFVVEGMYECVQNEDAVKTATFGEIDLQLIDEMNEDVDLLKFNFPARLLVVLANILYLRQTGLNKMIGAFAEAGISVDQGGQVQQALNNVEAAVTQLFLQSQIGRVITPIEREWLQGLDSRAGKVK